MTQGWRQIIVPAQYAIAAEVLKNPIQQLRRSETTETVIVAVSRLRRTDAHTFNRADGSAITTVDRRVPSSEEAAELLHLRNAEAVIRGNTNVANGVWLAPLPIPTLTGETATVRDDVIASWRDKFQIREEQRNGDQVVRTGLRPPQTGALYGVLGHWRSSNAPATVVMPTGTGKTETMLALLALEGLHRLLVVVPTNALREQIGDKFLRLGLLKSLGVLADDALYPVLCRLQRKPKSAGEVDQIFEGCNVVVTTMAIAGQCDEAVQRRMAEQCSHLFIDEAHHISARTWDAFRGNFIDRPIVQFTATPFRNDGKHVDGRIVFNYPLKKAQSEGYFKPIRFSSVDEIDQEEADVSIAGQAIAALRADMEKGYAHIIMARCGDIPRAQKVYALYAARAAEFNPVLLHNKISATEIRTAIAQLRSGERRVVVCVDMLGEGFDLPELKIAAIYDPHKSLAITLQFTGRFTRTRSDLGEATVIANVADPGVEEQLRVLYAEDADWNVLLRDLSEGANTRQARRSEFLDTFQDIPDEVSLRNIFPKMSAVVYRTGRKRWRPDLVETGLSGVEIYAGPTVNEKHKVLLFITREQEGVPWGDVRYMRNTEWHLYLLHWDEDQKLLFINSSNKATVHEELAKAACGDDVTLIRGETVFRSLHNVNRLVLTNLGLSDLINERLRFSMHVGSDISDVLPEALRLNKIKSRRARL